MQTIDIHTHLLSSDVKFNRLYDKVAKAMIANPYETYVDAITKNTKESQYIKKLVLSGVDARVDDEGSRFSCTFYIRVKQL